MPQKRNPISSEVILAQSKILRAQAGLVLDGMVSDFERASGPWHLEWAAIPTAFIAAVGSLHQAEFALSGLQVNQDAMMANLKSTKGLIVAEAVMMGLAVHTGRQAAHDIVYDACVSAHENNTSLREALAQVSAVTSALKPSEIDALCDPTKYLGCCQLMVDELLEQKTPSSSSRLNGKSANGEELVNVNSHNVVNGNGTALATGANGVH
jgi:3-carboxy-cis,cis-muconate cycloisomerase